MTPLHMPLENLQTGHNMRTKEMTLIVNILNVIYLSVILCCDFDNAIMFLLLLCFYTLRRGSFLYKRNDLGTRLFKE